MSATSVAEIINQLESLSYFTHVEAADLEQVKTELGTGLVEEHYFPYIESGRPRYVGLDPRQYILDNETLFEQGGVLDALKEMAPFFGKLGVWMEVSDHVEEYPDGRGLDHRITLNGKEYILFDNWEGSGWGESAQRFADMINDQLALQQSPERLYLIQGGNDGRGVFLTPEQYELVSPLIDNLNERPLPTKKWCEVMGVVWQDATSH